MGGRTGPVMTPSPTLTAALVEATGLREATLVTKRPQARLRGQP